MVLKKKKTQAKKRKAGRKIKGDESSCEMTQMVRLQESRMHAQRLEAVDRLAGGVAHDFNNLISVINGYCQLIASREGVSEEILRDIAEIHKAGQKAAALTRQLLAFGRRQPLNLQPLSLNALVKENEGLLRRLLDGAGVLELDLRADPVWVRGDDDQLQQVLLNLVLNARDALRDKGFVRISTSVCEVTPGSEAALDGVKPGVYGLMSVADNGTGMDAATQDHLFEPFYTTKEPGKGSGLGLAMVYGVVQQSEGHVRVKSAVLVGSTFDIYLPLTNEGEEHSETEGSPSGSAVNVALTSPLVTGFVGHGTRHAVLMIEDDQMVGKMSAGMLASDGHRVVAAANAKQALTRIKTLEGDVRVFIPSSGRKSDCERLCARFVRQATPVRVLCTMDCGEACLFEGKGKPGKRSMPKPYAMSELLRAVRDLVDMTGKKP